MIQLYSKKNNFFDIFLKRIVLRSLVASLVPMILYSVIYLIFLMDTYSYGNRIAWAIVAAVSMFYPLNWIWLYLIFVPIELFLNLILGSDATKDKFRKGNFAPVDVENSYLVSNDQIINGAIPLDITGVFLRNGPNPKTVPKTGRYHWFDG